MSNIIADNKRIALNTFFLYLRQVLVLFLTLYLSRLVLEVLGVEDFGIYNVVGGFVAMFSLVSSSLTSSIGRSLTFELGRRDMERLKKTFSMSIIIMI